MDTSGQSLSLPVAQAIEKFKTVFLQRVQALETVGKKDVASSLLEATLRTTLDPSPGKRDIELVQKHAGVLDTRSAINILAIRSKLQQLQRQGYDVPSSIEEISKRVDQVDLSVVGLPTRKRKRDPNSDSEANNELPKRPKSTPTERYLDNYKKRKAELDENEPETSPLAKRLRFTNYRDPILYVPDPIAFQFEDPFPASPDKKEVGHVLNNYLTNEFYYHEYITDYKYNTDDDSYNDKHESAAQ